MPHPDEKKIPPLVFPREVSSVRFRDKAWLGNKIGMSDYASSEKAPQGLGQASIEAPKYGISLVLHSQGLVVDGDLFVPMANIATVQEKKVV